MSNSMTGRTLYHGSSNNGLNTILSPAAHAALKEMYARAAAGEDWESIHSTTPQPTGIYVFCPVDWWGHGLEQVATGTFEEMSSWLRHFEEQGGVVLPSETSNYVPLSNQFFRADSKAEQGCDAMYPRPDIEVCTIFGITPDMLRDRTPIMEPMHAS